MKKTMIVAAALASSMFAGSVMAMEINNSFTDKEMMSPFYTDDTMATGKSEAEVKQILSEMNPQAREALKKDCDDPKQYRDQFHYGICDVLKTL